MYSWCSKYFSRSFYFAHFMIKHTRNRRINVMQILTFFRTCLKSCIVLCPYYMEWSVNNLVYINYYINKNFLKSQQFNQYQQN